MFKGVYKLAQRYYLCAMMLLTTKYCKDRNNMKMKIISFMASKWELVKLIWLTN